MITTPRVIAGGTAILAALTLSACAQTDQAPSAQATPSASPTPRNPVPILEQIEGCKLEEGTTLGEYDFGGNRFASCDFYDNEGEKGTSIQVRTFTYDPSQVQNDFTGPQIDDSHKVIIGPDFIATITGDWTTYSKHIDPEKIATQIGGKTR